jgi:integrase
MEKTKVISYEKIKEIVNSIASPRLSAMVAVQYGLAARAGELITYQHTSQKQTPGLLKSNITQVGGVWICPIPNFKNAKQEFKRPYISPKEDFIFRPFKFWFDQCDEQVFDLRVARWRELVKGVLPLGLASHSLRHSRATHLAEVFGFSAFEIKAFLGHARLDTSAIYVHQDLSKSAGKIEEALK